VLDSIATNRNLLDSYICVTVRVKVRVRVRWGQSRLCGVSSEGILQMVHRISGVPINMVIGLSP